MSTRPFRFGVTAGQIDTVEGMAAVAATAEQLGFDTLLVPDPAGPLDPMTILSAATAVTTRLHVGTFVLAAPYRDPKSLAWQAMSLHEFTGGRFELGLGLGRPGGERQAGMLGRDYGTPRQRLAWLTENVEELRRHDDRPRLMIAGAGPKVLDLAARTADVVTLTWSPTTTPDEADPIVARFRETAGDRADDIELNLNLISAGDRPAPGITRFIGVTTAELAKMGAISVLPDSPEENARTLLRWRDRWGISYVTVNADYMHEFAPIIERLKA